MANTTPTYQGKANFGSDEDALFLKMFSGEVLRTFNQKNKLLPMIKTKTIGAGKTFSWPKVSQAVANYHVRGQDILTPGNNYIHDFENNEVLINVDKVLLAATVVDEWEELVNHYDARSIYAAELGAALATRMDKQLFGLMINSAREQATLSTQRANANPDYEQTVKDGTLINSAQSGTSATAMLDALIAGATAFAEKDVPMDEIYFFVRPSMYFQLAKLPELVNRDFATDNGGPVEGKVFRGYGFNIMFSNNIPDGVVSADAGENNTYSGDFSTTTAVGFHKEAIVTVMRRGIVSRADYQERNLATLLQSHLVCGHGTLRPECAIEVRTAAP